jgi:outer membrane protein TolC
MNLLRINMSVSKSNGSVNSGSTKWLQAITLALTLVSLLSTGCYRRAAFRDPADYISNELGRIAYPAIADKSIENADQLMTSEPPTISNYKDLAPWELTLEEAIRLSLQNSKVVQKLGGRVVTAPSALQTVYDPAIQYSDPRQGEEAALSAFDAQFRSSFFLAEASQVGFAFNNVGQTTIATQSRSTQAEIAKLTAGGTRFAMRNVSQYSDNGSSVLPSTINTLLQAEVRQPILRGAGTQVNRIAGPNSLPGVYNGVLIARINHDISAADFEASIRDLVRDVENSYWELYFAYRDLDSKLQGREAARQVWENRKARSNNGLGRPDEEAQARQQYYNYETQVEAALCGVPNLSTGVFTAEREIRRMIGALNNDGTLIRPITEPLLARVTLDWQAAQSKALDGRVELRRQKWVVRQRELELLAARNLNQFQLDFVGQFGYRGIEPIKPNNRDVFGLYAANNYAENWNLGVEFSGPIGKRVYHVAARNAELRLARDKALLQEQQRQILYDLNAAYTEVDRAFNAIKSNYNNLIALEEELDAKRKRVAAGEEEIFFLLDAEQRATAVRTNLHRSIANYNIALLNYWYAGGDLLDRYQISLAEGPWHPEAYMNAEKSLRNLGTHEGDYRWSESTPVTHGEYVQQSESIAGDDIYRTLPGQMEALPTTEAPGRFDRSAPADPPRPSESMPLPLQNPGYQSQAPRQPGAASERSTSSEEKRPVTFGYYRR